MLHTGIRLAATRRSKQYRVLLVDMDLEAPGLDTYLPFHEKGKPRMSGFAGLLKGYRNAEQKVKWLEENMEDDQFVVPIPNADNLWAMPSGIKGEHPEHGSDEYSYLDIVSALGEEIPSTTHPSRPQSGFFHDFGRVLRDRFTYVLIDSRAGLAEQAYASTLLLADALVLCFRLNLANIEGIQAVLGNYLLREQTCLGDKDAKIIPVATPIPARGGTDIEKWIELAQQAFLGKGKDTKDSETPLDSSIQRVFLEPSLEIGERLLFEYDGELKEGYSEETPVVRSFNQLAGRIATMNAGKDAVAAREAEIRHFNKDRYEEALGYLFKRIRLEPCDLKTWNDIDNAYAQSRTTRFSVKSKLKTLITEWRKSLGQLDTETDSDNARRLAYVLFGWTTGFGMDHTDAGLSSIRECLTLAGGDNVLRERAEDVYGQVVEELIRRGSVGLIENEETGEPLSLELANRCFSKAIELGLENDKKGGRSYLNRARNFGKLHRWLESVRDYDSYLAEVVQENGEEIDGQHVVAIFEQAAALEFLGHYDLAFQNYRAALAKKPLDADVARKLCATSARLELNDFEAEISRLWEQEEPTNPAVYRVRALSRLSQGRYEETLEATRLANLYASDMKTSLLEVHVHLFQGDFAAADDTAREVANKLNKSYATALRTITAILAGRKANAKAIEALEDGNEMIPAIAALAMSQIELAQEFLEKINLSEITACDQLLCHLLQAACKALSGGEASVLLAKVAASIDQIRYLGVAFRNDPEMRVFRLVYDFLEAHSKCLGPGAEGIRELLASIDSVKAPILDDLPARRVTESMQL
ncbi:MAG: hypothetical protein HQ567_30290 [Candidatus Nealsonbacteria bacterium]|nr:hypothetical protein [Candidatus Nealsonbacteria bacterium]